MNLLHWPQALGENKIKTSKPSTCTFIPPLYLSSALNEGIAWPCWWNVNIPWQACVCSPLSSSEGGMDICLLYASHSYYISTGTHVLQHWSQMSRAKWRANIPGYHYKALPSFTGSTLRPKTNNRSFPVPIPSQGGSRREKEGTSSGRGQKKSCRSFLCLFWQPLRAPTTLAIICLHLLSHSYRFPQSIPMQRVFRDVDVFMSKGEILATGIWWLVQSMYSDLKMLLCWKQHKAFLRLYQCFG